MKKRIGISLRYKLLGLLITLPLVSLSLYLVMATELFQKDKVAYVFDSSATVSRSLATQTRMEIQNSYESLRAVTEGFDFAVGDFSQGTKDAFEKNARIQAVLIFRKDDSGQFVKLGQLLKPVPQAQKFSEDQSVQNQIRSESLTNGAYFGEDSASPGNARLPSASVSLTIRTKLW